MLSRPEEFFPGESTAGINVFVAEVSGIGNLLFQIVVLRVNGALVY